MDPSRLHEEYTRYHVYLQVKKDLVTGRLVAPVSTVCLLTSYAVQSTLGDFDPDSCRNGYLAPFRNLRTHCPCPGGAMPPTEELDRKVAELHKLHKGQSPAEAELNFLEHAKRLEMYGISLHPGKDSAGRDIPLGVTSNGLVVFQNCIKINTFSWTKIVKISFKRKQFFIQLRKEVTESYDTLLGFNLSSYRSCKNLWKSAVEHHSFFRLQSPKTPGRKFSLLGLSSKFRYSGRTEFQTVSETAIASNQAKSRWERAFFRSPSRRVLRQTMPNLERSRNILASPEHSSIGSSTISSSVSNGHLKPGSENVKPTSGSRVSLAVRAYESFNNRVQSLGVRSPRRAWGDESDDEGGFLAGTIPRLRSHAPSLPPGIPSTGPPSSSPSTKTRSPTDLSKPPALFSFADDSSSERGNSEPPISQTSHGRASSEPPSQASTVRLSSYIPPSPASTLQGTVTPVENGEHSDNPVEEVTSQDDATSETSGGSGIVTVTISPDTQGRFGFNVKGGADQGVPVIVSRVAAGTPADKCEPRLSEGDQVVMINGRDVATMTHDQVVNFIRAAREPHSGQLVLSVRQNVYLGEEVEEPVFQYVPEKILSPRLSGLVAGQSQSPLQQSMLLLEEGLQSGNINGQFEQLPRRNHNLTISECHLPDNAAKNRYKDISPYNATRVKLTECPTGDYINANHVVMEVPGSGIVNRYIATQGPLSSTCIDFWYMVMEQESPLVIMLTTVVERGRVKCHKYWPALDSTVLYGSISVTCTREENKDSFSFRDFTLVEVESGTERPVSQMQYLSWPDHGTPSDTVEFVEFVENVRDFREKSATVAPTIVHCSAGIGRTGVLILMETAACLIEANQAVYPLDLTRTMRDQRPAMIQTPSQYKFVCEAISSCYKEGKIQPLPEFSQQH